MKWIKRTLVFLFILVTIIYVAAGAFLYYNQDKFLFLNEQLADDYEFRKGEEQLVTVDHNINLSCYINETRNSKGVLLYFHGNKGSIRRCIRQTESMEGLGYDIFMPDYRSYGKSDGENIDEEQFFKDAQEVYDFLKTKYDESDIAIVGYSLGTAPACYLAANNDPAHLFLISPFYSIVDIVRSYFPLVPEFLFRFPFKNHENLQGASCPVDIFYAEADRVVPPHSTLRLKNRKQKAQFHALRNTSHRGAIFHGKVPNTLDKRLN